MKLATDVMNTFQIKKRRQISTFKKYRIRLYINKKSQQNLACNTILKKNIKQKELKLNAILKYRYMRRSTTEAISKNKSNLYAIKRNSY